MSFNSGGTISSLFNTGGTIRVASLVINATTFHNDGTLAMSNGTYQTVTQLTNGPTAWITGYGTINTPATLVNHGTILANNSTLALVIGSALESTGRVLATTGRLIVSGIFTNDGTLNFQNSYGTFNSAVVNRGAWISDPSTLTFLASHTETTNGYINAGDGDRYVFQGDLVNQSTNKVLWNTLNVTPGTNTSGQGTTFLFQGTGLTQTQEFFQAGLALTSGFTGSPTPLSNGVQDVTSFAAVGGFQNNFAVGQLMLTNTTLALAPTVPGGPTGALFVNDLFLFDLSHLVISNNMRLYFVNSNSWDMANITLLGSAEIHQLNSLTATTNLLVIPEPNVLLMWLSGVVTLWAARRRARSRHR